MGSSRSGLLISQKLPREWISREAFNTCLEPFVEPFVEAFSPGFPLRVETRPPALLEVETFR